MKNSGISPLSSNAVAKPEQGSTLCSGLLWTEPQHSCSWKGAQVVSSPASCQAGSALSSDQITQAFMQSGPKTFQGRRQCSLSGQPAPVLGSPHNEAIFPYQSEPLSLWLMSVFSHPPVMQWCKGFFPLFSTDLCIMASEFWRRKIKPVTSNHSNLNMLSSLCKLMHALKAFCHSWRCLLHPKSGAAFNIFGAEQGQVTFPLSTGV